MWRKGGVVATLMLLRSDSSPAQKNERSCSSLSERSVRILSGRSLSDSDSLTLVSESLRNSTYSLASLVLRFCVTNATIDSTTYMISTTVPRR
jgi:hypothetical protein